MIGEANTAECITLRSRTISKVSCPRFLFHHTDADVAVALSRLIAPIERWKAFAEGVTWTIINGLARFCRSIRGWTEFAGTCPLRVIAPPIRRHFKLALPNAEFQIFCLRFLADVIHRILPIGQRPTLSHHPSINIFTTNQAHSDNAAVPI